MCDSRLCPDSGLREGRRNSSKVCSPSILDSNFMLTMSRYCYHEYENPDPDRPRPSDQRLTNIQEIDDCRKLQNVLG